MCAAFVRVCYARTAVFYVSNEVSPSMEASAGAHFRVSWQTCQTKRHCPEPIKPETVFFFFFDCKRLQLTKPYCLNSQTSTSTETAPVLFQHFHIFYGSFIGRIRTLRFISYVPTKSMWEFLQWHMGPFSKERGRYRMLY